jgi:hypothetical protein
LSYRGDGSSTMERLWGKRTARLLVLALGLLAFASLSVAHSANAAECPNEALRTGASAGLPDCRAYEKVSPGPKNGGDGVRGGFPTLGTADGEGLSFMSYGTFSGSPSGSFPNAYIGRRGANGWQITPASPPNPDPSPAGAGLASYEFNSNLSLRVVNVLQQSLAEGATPEVNNLFAVDSAGTYSWVNNMPPEVKLPEECPLPEFESLCYQLVDLVAFAGASEDFQHVLFEYKGSFFNPESFETLYRSDFEGGSWHVSPVDVLPDGQPSKGSTAGSGSSIFYSSAAPLSDNRVATALSADGSNVVFQAESDEGEPNEAGQAGLTQVYDRIGRTRTVELSAPVTGATPANPAAGSAEFWAASTDGSRVFFTSHAELTTPSNTGPANEGNDLYEYNFSGGGTLKDLTVDSADPAGAEVLGVLEASTDGSSIYIVARGELVPGKGEAGQPNLYEIRDGGLPVFIATLREADEKDWTPSAASRESYVTPSGNDVAFTSVKSLPTANFPAGYDNVNPQTATPEPEVYEYSASTGELMCVSCDPSGAPPIGAGMLGGVRRPEAEGESQSSPFHMVRSISANGGRVFFSSPDPLVPSVPATSTLAKVYEFEHAGEGSCATSGGCVELISSPTDNREAIFMEADESGSNAFFATGARLTASDEDNALDVYDARVDGGFPEPPPQPPCEGEGCRGPGTSVAAPTTNSPTGSFQGPGNAVKRAAKKPCRKGQVKKHGRCVKKTQKKPKHKKGKGGHHKKNRAGAKQGAAR